MASVLTWPAGRSFLFTHYQAYDADPNRPWVNTLWTLSTAEGDLDDLIELGRALAAAYAALLWSTAKITRWRVSTGYPEDPESSTDFYEEPINMAGSVLATGNQVMDRRNVLWIEKTAYVGRPGRLFLRGALAEAYIKADAGIMSIDPAAASVLNGRVGDFTLAIDDWIHASATKNLSFVLIKADGTDPRWVTAFRLRGATMCKHDHRWFDRGGPLNQEHQQSTTPPQDIPYGWEDPPLYVPIEE